MWRSFFSACIGPNHHPRQFLKTRLSAAATPFKWREGEHYFVSKASLAGDYTIEFFGP